MNKQTTSSGDGEGAEGSDREYTDGLLFSWDRKESRELEEVRRQAMGDLRVRSRELLGVPCKVKDAQLHLKFR